MLPLQVRMSAIVPYFLFRMAPINFSVLWISEPYFDKRSKLNGKERAMTLNLQLQPILAILAGILILVKPSLLNYIVAIFLILFGILGLI